MSHFYVETYTEGLGKCRIACAYVWICDTCLNVYDTKCEGLDEHRYMVYEDGHDPPTKTDENHVCYECGGKPHTLYDDEDGPAALACNQPVSVLKRIILRPMSDKRRAFLIQIIKALEGRL